MAIRLVNLLLCCSICLAQMVCCCAAQTAATEAPHACCCQRQSTDKVRGGSCDPAGQESEPHQCPCKMNSWLAGEFAAASGGVQSTGVHDPELLFASSGVAEILPTRSALSVELQLTPGWHLSGRTLLHALQIMRC